MGDWTPEPWEVDSELNWIIGDGNKIVVTLRHSQRGDPCQANARRIVACVNALEGWTTEALEQLAAPIADQLRERDERIRKLEEAARAAYAHVIELQDAWIRGVLSEHDGLGGTRSNRNDDVLHLITHALGEG